jgi:acyl-CoA thioesterase
MGGRGSYDPRARPVRAGGRSLVNRFDRDTALEPLGDGRFAGRMDRGWWITRGPNGGYVAAILLRAAELATADAERAPRSLTVHYVAPPEEGPVVVETRRERVGRSLTTVSLRLVQGERLLGLGLAALSKSRPSPALDATRMPEVPPPESCPRLSSEAAPIPIRERYDQRPAFAPAGAPAEGRTGGWIRLVEPRVPDALLVAALTDAWPPAIFAWMQSRPGQGRGVPTMDLTIHFRSRLPLPGAAPEDFSLAIFHTRLVHDGFLEEDGEVWSRDGVLLAQSRQLALVV